MNMIAMPTTLVGYFAKRGRLPGLVLLLIGLLTACSGHLAETSNSRDPKARLARAEAIFQERCKTAGEKIYRTAEDVEGVFLMKVRPSEINYSDQFKMDDPYGRDVGGEGYISNFLMGRDAKKSLVNSNALTKGYSYVEILDLADGKRYRYTGSVREAEERLSGLSGGGTVRITKFALDKTPAQGSQPRYGVTYDDISTREEREYWIAGSSLKVIDLKTNEVIAERIGYMMDRGQGNTSGGRSPWFWAAYYACPAFSLAPGGQPFKLDQTRDFVEKVLRIKQGN